MPLGAFLPAWPRHLPFDTASMGLRRRCAYVHVLVQAGKKRKEKWGGEGGTGFSGREETTEGEEEVSCWALARAGSSVSVLVIGKGTTPRASLVPPLNYYQVF